MPSDKLVLPPERSYLIAALDRAGLSLRAASLRIGRNATYLHDYVHKESPRRLAAEDRDKLAEILGCSAVELQAPDARARSNAPPHHTAVGNARIVNLSEGMITSMPRDLPVRGTAAGALQGSFQLEDAVIEFVVRPPALVGVKDAYAIYVLGTSMQPAFRPGDLAYIHPHRPASLGDHVVAIVQGQGGEPPQAFLKELKKLDESSIWLGQYNPAATIKLARKTVVSLHKVMRTSELFRA